MNINKQIIIHIAIFIVILAVFELTNLDIQIQDHFFNWNTNTWLVDTDNLLLATVFYTGPKYLLVTFGTACLICFALSFKMQNLKKYRRFSLLMFMALSIIPAAIGFLKSISNVYYPSKIERYGGNKPYVKVFEKYPAGFKQNSKSRGWPAGHASGGFAMMMLYFALPKKYRYFGLLVAIYIGWHMGLYQMLKGAHYLSHTVITMSLSWILILAIHKITSGFKPSPDTDTN
jgi:membrane-associated PAP2 superfamily phosphatase